MKNQTLKLKITLSVLVIAFMIFPFVPETFAAEKTTLKLNLKPGQKYNRVIRMEEKILQTVMGQQMNIDHMKKLGLEFEVKDVDTKGIASAMVTYRTIQEKTSSFAGEGEYDSENPSTLAENPLAPTYTALMDDGFIMKIAPNGKIVELTGFDKMLSRMAEKMVAAEDEMISKMPPSKCSVDKGNAADRKKQTEESQEQRAKRRIDGMNKMYGSRDGRVKALKEMLEKNPLMAEKQIKLMLVSVMAPFPDKPVQAGDSWTDKMVLNVMLPAEVDSVYTLKGDKGNVAIISGSFERTMKDPAIDFINAGPVQSKMKMEGSYQRSLEIDKSSGWMIRSNSKLKISGEMKIPGNAQMPQGMTVPMTVESIVTVEP
ncbi:MAG: DUF6263 family protein [Planctomycetota bacterium]|jgi:hypothetical protein